MMVTESNGSLQPGLWRYSLHTTCGMTACTPGSSDAGPMLGNEYGNTVSAEMTWRRHATADPR